jgi:uncharacterized protein involved in outer membrane biogenesis
VSETRFRGQQALKWAGIAVGVVAVLLIVLSLVDWNALRGPISRMASAKAGRPVQIHGDLNVRLFSWSPLIIVNGLEVGNPRWAGKEPMARVERLEAQIRLPSLLVGNIVFPTLRVSGAKLDLKRNAEGDANWSSPRKSRAEPGAPLKLPVVRRFELEGTYVSYVDEQRKLSFQGVVAANESTFGKDAQPFRAVALGKMNDKPFQFHLRSGALVNVRRDRPYAYQAEVVAGPTRATAKGVIARPFDLGNFVADVSLAGDDLSDLFYLTGIALPNTPPYKVSGRFDRKGTLVTFRKVQGVVGDSDIRGDVEVELKGRRPFVEATLASRSLDLDDVATWFGAPPSIKKAETASAEQKSKGVQMKAAGKLLPDAPLKMERVHAMNAHVKYTAAAVRSGRFPIRAIDMELRLNDGVLSFEPVALRMPQGNISAHVRMNAQKDVPVTDLDASITGLELGQFKPKNSNEPPVEGVLRGRLKLHGEGNSVRRFASSSDGVVTFVVPQGEIRQAFAELTGINVARGLGLLLSKDQDKTLVRCGVADFKVNDGILHAQNIVFDTENVLITGKGDVSLDDETFDLSVRGQPKKLRFFRVRSPIAVNGPLRKPSVGIQADKAAGQAGVAAALGALAPIAAVLAFVDPGLAEDANCSALLAEAKKGGAPVKTAEVNRADQDNEKAERR